MTGFRNATVLIDGKLVKTSLVIKDGKIDGFYEADGQINLPEGAIVLPGFIDEHTHGALGSDTMDANVADYKTIASQLVKEGTTAFLLTTMTASKEGIIDSIKAYNEFCSLPNDYATPVGIHLEGPFINPNKCGAQPKEYIAIPEIEAIKEYASLSNGSIKLITVAPEVDGALEFIKFCKGLGITLTAGHTSATYEEFKKGVDSGVTCTTHTYNAMSPFTHREIGVVGGALLEDVYNEVIADGIHVSIPAIKLLTSLKKDKLILVTDAMRAKGVSDGESELGGQKVYVKNGEARLADGTLAGSTLTMDKAFKNMVEKVGLTIEETAKAVSENPAKNLGIFDEYGSIEKGKRANLTILDNNLSVIMTVVNGKIAFSK